MEVILVYHRGVVEGLRESMDVESDEPFDHRTKTTVGDAKGEIDANVSVYVFDSEASNLEACPPEWHYQHLKRMTAADYRDVWKPNHERRRSDPE